MDQRSYQEQLEARCEQLQEQLSSLHSGIANFFKLKIVVEKNKTQLYLETTTPKRCDQKEGDVEFACPPVTSNTISLCVAINTTVDDVKKWYLEFCDGSRGYCDSTLLPQELGLIIAKKFSLAYVPIEVIIKDKDHKDYKGGDFLDAGYIYAPYVPMSFGGAKIPGVTPAQAQANFQANVNQMAGISAAQKSIMQRYAQQANQYAPAYANIGIK